MPTPHVVCATVCQATEKSLRGNRLQLRAVEPRPDTIVNWRDTPKYVLTSTRKVPTHSREKDEKARNISETDRLYVLEERRVKLLLRKIVGGDHGKGKLMENLRPLVVGNTEILRPIATPAKNKRPKTNALTVERSCTHVSPCYWIRQSSKFKSSWGLSFFFSSRAVEG